MCVMLWEKEESQGQREKQVTHASTRDNEMSVRSSGRALGTSYQEDLFESKEQEVEDSRENCVRKEIKRSLKSWCFGARSLRR